MIDTLPKAKAEELVQRYFKAKHQPYGFKDAQQCAIIAVDEIIIEREVVYASIGIPPGTFWIEVEREIEAL